MAIIRAPDFDYTGLQYLIQVILNNRQHELQRAASERAAAAERRASTDWTNQQAAQQAAQAAAIDQMNALIGAGPQFAPMSTQAAVAGLQGQGQPSPFMQSGPTGASAFNLASALNPFAPPPQPVPASVAPVPSEYEPEQAKQLRLNPAIAGALRAQSDPTLSPQGRHMRLVQAAGVAQSEATLNKVASAFPQERRDLVKSLVRAKEGSQLTAETFNQLMEAQGMPLSERDKLNMEYISAQLETLRRSAKNQLTAQQSDTIATKELQRIGILPQGIQQFEGATSLLGQLRVGLRLRAESNEPKREDIAKEIRGTLVGYYRSRVGDTVPGTTIGPDGSIKLGGTVSPDQAFEEGANIVKRVYGDDAVNSALTPAFRKGTTNPDSAATKAGVARAQRQQAQGLGPLATPAPSPFNLGAAPFAQPPAPPSPVATDQSAKLGQIIAGLRAQRYDDARIEGMLVNALTADGTPEPQARAQAKAALKRK